MPNFCEKRTFVTTWYVHIRVRIRRTYQGVRKISFSENLTCFVFLKYPFWDSPFCLITDEISVAFDDHLLFWNAYSSLLGEGFNYVSSFRNYGEMKIYIIHIRTIYSLYWFSKCLLEWFQYEILMEWFIVYKRNCS